MFYDIINLVFTKCDSFYCSKYDLEGVFFLYKIKEKIMDSGRINDTIIAVKKKFL